MSDMMFSRLAKATRNDLSGLGTSRKTQLSTETVFQELLNRSSQLIWLLDGAGRVLQANQTALTFGNVELSQVTGQPVYSRWQFSPAEQARLKDKIAATVDGRTIRYDTTIQGRAGQTVSLNVILREVALNKGQPTLLMMEGTDVGDRKQIEAQLLRCQRLQSVGAITAGLAHDFGNLLTGMSGSLYVLKNEFPDTNVRQKKMFEILETTTARAGKLVKQMLTFTKGNAAGYSFVACDALIREIQTLIATILPPKVPIETYLPDGLWPINGDENQLHQVLMNLCVNARDAMPDGGFLRLSAENIRVCETEAVEKAVKDYIMIQVSDTGSGISNSVIDSIFDPFFTTKESESGTGLGLSMAKDIIERHGGFIDVLSVATHISRTGTQFRIYLPAAA